MWTVREFWRSWALCLWLVAVLPLLKGALAGNIPWLNDLLDSHSRAAWWRLAGATFFFQWIQFAAGVLVVRREGPGLAELGLAGPAAGSYRAVLGVALVLFAGLLVARHTARAVARALPRAPVPGGTGRGVRHPRSAGEPRVRSSDRAGPARAVIGRRRFPAGLKTGSMTDSAIAWSHRDLTK